MAQPSFVPVPPPPTPFSVISPHFCSPYPVDLTIVRKVLTLTDGNFVVQDVNGNLIFKVKGSLVTLHDRRVLLDSAGNPIVTLRRKVLTAHERWEVFRGESKDLLFSVKQSSMIQFKTKLDVFLAHNSAEKSCDFMVKGSWSEKSCIVYAGESNTIVAQMHKRMTAQSLLMGKDHFMVTVYPNIDYAFVVALVVILDEINDGSDDE